MITQEIDRSISVLKAAHKGDFPKVALILGSGLGKFGDMMDIDSTISYDQIPDFPSQPLSVVPGGC